MRHTPAAQPTRRRSWLRHRLVWLLPLNALLALALLAAVWADNALNRGIPYTPDPQPIPLADGPTLGVNVYNLHLEPDPAVVTRTLELAADMGVQMIRMQMPWEDVEIHGRGDFLDRRNVEAVGVVSAWAKYDRIIAQANALGMEVMLRLDRPPLWARQVNNATPFFQEGLQRDPTSTGPPDDFEDFARFVGQVVARYRGQVRYFQIWNEPNLKNEWNWHVPSPEAFVVLLKVAHREALRANPDAVIVFPSLAPVDGLDRRAPMTELDYLDGIYREGGAAYFDVMSAQAYGLGQPPDEHRYVRLLPWGDTWTWRRFIDTRADVSRVVLLREVMEQHGDAHKPIWVSEFGWNSAPESIPPERRFTWGLPVTEQQKAAYIVGHMERARQEWPWMGTMFVWKMRFGGYREPDPADPTPYFSLVGRDWEVLPAYEALRAYTSAPPVAGLGAHPWQHPAAEALPNGRWQLRFEGSQVALLGAPALQEASSAATINGASVPLEGITLDGQRALTTPELGNGVHVLELALADLPPPDQFVVSRAPPLPLWLWSPLLGGLVAALALSMAAALPSLFSLARAGVLRSPPAQIGLRPWLHTRGGEATLLLGMLAGLLFFYKGYSDVPPALAGLALFGLLALLRPDLGLLFVPLTASLFFMPKGLWDARFLPPDGIRLPLHEMALLLVAAATAAHLAARGLQRWRAGALSLRVPAWPQVGRVARAYAPHALLVVAGTVGVLVALPEGRGAALREWRWLIVEPLLFYALVRIWQRVSAAPQINGRLLAAFGLGGALVGLIGILQLGGLNLAPYVGEKVSFSADTVAAEGVQRVTSVYGHPNNLGLFMGRVGPLLLALALGGLVCWPVLGRWQRVLLVLGAGGGALLAYGGLVVSFSKGALLGALMGLALLAWGGWWLWRQQRPEGLPRGVSRLAGFAVGLLLIGLPLLAGWLIVSADLVQRLNPLGATAEVRLKLWASSLAMLRDAPLLGVGLDQFLRLYPQYIDPALAHTNERFTSHPHNLLLNSWLRLGLLGVLALGWLLLRFGRRVWHHATAASGGRPQVRPWLALGLAAAMVAALGHGLVDNFYFVPDLALSFWLLIALADDGEL